MSTALNDQPVLSAFNLPDATRKHGLLSVLNNVTDSSPQWIYSGLDIETICGGVGTSTAFCLDEEGTVEDKQPFTGDWPHLTPFAVYALHECSSIGKPMGERAADAQHALNLGEQTALEGQFATLALADPDLTTGTGTDLVDALATADALAGYEAGRVIHLNPADVTRLAGKGVLKKNDSGLSTYNGTPVVSGLGYPADLGVLVTGPVLGASGEMFTTETVLDRLTNLLSVLAEKPWALGYACGATRITTA